MLPTRAISVVQAIYMRAYKYFYNALLKEMCWDKDCNILCYTYVLQLPNTYVLKTNIQILSEHELMA